MPEVNRTRRGGARALGAWSAWGGACRRRGGTPVLRAWSNKEHAKRGGVASTGAESKWGVTRFGRGQSEGRVRSGRGLGRGRRRLQELRCPRSWTLQLSLPPFGSLPCWPSRRVCGPNAPGRTAAVGLRPRRCASSPETAAPPPHPRKLRSRVRRSPRALPRLCPQRLRGRG
jgi:hypothetical protein